MNAEISGGSSVPVGQDPVLNAVVFEVLTARGNIGAQMIGGIVTPVRRTKSSQAPAPVWDQDNWRNDAACLDSDPEVFYPLQTGNKEDILEAENRAKRICAICPVVESCLGFAISTREREGVWGGTSETERRRLIRSNHARRPYIRASKTK